MGQKRIINGKLLVYACVCVFFFFGPLYNLLICSYLNLIRCDRKGKRENVIFISEISFLNSSDLAVSINRHRTIVYKITYGLIVRI